MENTDDDSAVAVDAATTTNGSAHFTTGRIFAALALFNQLTVPLFIFPLTVPIIIAAIVSTRRLERFLALQEVQKEFEGIRNMARAMSRSDASLDVFEIEDNESQSEAIDDPVVNGANGDTIPAATSATATSSTVEAAATTIEYIGQSDDINRNYHNDNCYVGPLATGRTQMYSKRPMSASVKLKKNNQLSSNTRMERNRGRQKSITKEIQMEISSDLIVSIRNATFRWSADAISIASNNIEPSLKIDQLEIPKGNLNRI